MKSSLGKVPQLLHEISHLQVNKTQKIKKPQKWSLLGRPVKFPAYQTFLIFYVGSIFYKEDKNLGPLHLNKQSFLN